MNGLLNHTDSSGNWRYYFISGLLLGAAIYQFFNSDSFIPRQDYPLWLIAISGFLVGFGARLGNGCTSGHGICGLAALSKRSLVRPYALWHRQC